MTRGSVAVAILIGKVHAPFRASNEEWTVLRCSCPGSRTTHDCSKQAEALAEHLFVRHLPPRPGVAELSIFASVHPCRRHLPPGASVLLNTHPVWPVSHRATEWVVAPYTIAEASPFGRGGVSRSPGSVYPVNRAGIHAAPATGLQRIGYQGKPQAKSTAFASNSLGR